MTTAHDAGPAEHAWYGWGGWFANYDGEFDAAMVRYIFEAANAMRDELRMTITRLEAERDALKAWRQGERV